MIQRLYIAQCDRCQLYVAPTSSRTPALHDLALSATRAAEQDAVAYAVMRGWCAYPLLCPACNDLIRGGLREQARGDDAPPEGDGLYANLAKILNALDQAGECVRLEEGAVTGVSTNVEWDPNGRRYVVVQA